VYQNLVFYPDSEVIYESITVDQGTFAIGAKSTLQTMSFNATNNSVLSVGGGSVVNADVLSLLTSTTLWVMGTDNTGLVGDVWAGKGGTFTVGDLTVDATSRVTSDGQGYTAGYFREGMDGGGKSGNWYGSGAGGMVEWEEQPRGLEGRLTIPSPGRSNSARRVVPPTTGT
jgi:hypothetical protein